MKAFISKDLQDIILKLNKFWSIYNCVNVCSHDVQMGAATFHPVTIFSIINSNKCRLCYVQSIRRPFDGSYSLKTNKFQQYYQYQVVLKPFYKNIHELYINSLIFIGFNIKEHYLYFKESSWNSPSLCAWGVGWECKLNNIEISQITYFKEMCNIKCIVPTIEITYGIERLIQIKNIFNNYFYREIGYSYYNFKLCNINNLLNMFFIYESEFYKLNKIKIKEIYYPLYDNYIFMVHIYNLLISKKKLKKFYIKLILLKLQSIIKTISLIITEKKI